MDDSYSCAAHLFQRSSRKSLWSAVMWKASVYGGRERWFQLIYKHSLGFIFSLACSAANIHNNTPVVSREAQFCDGFLFKTRAKQSAVAKLSTHVVEIAN